MQDPGTAVLSAPTSMPRSHRWKAIYKDFSLVDLLFLLVAAVQGLSYWILSYIYHPNDPVSVYVIYRYGDLQFLPSISAIARFNFGEPSVYEFWGQGVASGQILGFLFYGIFYRLLGEWGFPVADAIVSAGAFLIFRQFFRQIGIGKFISGIFSILMATMNVHLLNGIVPNFLNPAFIRLSDVHGMRFVRPHLTTPLIFVILILFILLLSNQHSNKMTRTFLWLGASISILLQAGDPFSAFILLMSVMALAIVYILVREESLRSGLLSMSAFAATFALAFLPRLIISANENPDVVVRNGFFPVNRLAPLWEVSTQDWVLLTKVMVCLVAGLLLFRKDRLAPMRDLKQRVILLLIGLNLLAFFNLPITCVVFGQSIQPYHFKEAVKLFIGISLVVFSALVLDWTVSVVVSWVKSGSAFRIARWTFAIIFVLFVLNRIFITAEEVASNSRQMRPDFWPSNDHYRQNFSLLTMELGKEKESGKLALATFDHQVSDWWVSMAHGYAFNPDIYTTTITDEEYERRFMILCRLLGISTNEFLNTIQKNNINIWWFGFNKYQFSSVHTFRPLNDYSPEQKRLMKNSIYSNWIVAIPQSELRRLAKAYENVPPWEGFPKLDLIVLRNIEERNLFPASQFKMSYKNELFRVYRKTD